MQLRFGINTCFAAKRWPRVEDWGPLVRDRLGLRLVQHSFDLVEPGVPGARAFREQVMAQALVLDSTFTGLAAYSNSLLLHPDDGARGAAEDWFGWAIEWTSQAGARSFGGHLGALSVADWTDQERRRERWAALHQALERLTRRARSAGLDHLVVENLAAAREPSTMAMIRDLVTEGDDDHVPLRLCLDVGHMCVPGTSGDERDPYAWIRTMAPLTSMVQLQQSDAEGDHHWPFTTRRNAGGRISADRVIDALGEGGVDRMDLFLEVIPAFEQPDAEVLDDVRASVDYWSEALARRGVAVPG